MIRAALALLGLAVGAVACVAPSNEGSAPAQACLASIQFADDDAREQFVVSNISLLSAGARDEELYATSNGTTGASVEFISAAPMCSEASLRERLRLGTSRIAFTSVSTLGAQDAQLRLSSAMATRRDEQHQWRCVVRARHEGFIGPLVVVMHFVGLRTPQVEGANDNLFLAAEDGCETVSAVLVQAVQDVEERHLTPSDYAVCPLSSLVQCGYPPEIEIVP